MESWKICNFDPKANFNIDFNISNVGYQGQLFKLLKGSGTLWPTSCVHIPLLSSVTWAFTYNFTRALTQTKGKSKTKLKDSFEEGCSAQEASNLSFTSAWVVDICLCHHGYQSFFSSRAAWSFGVCRRQILRAWKVSGTRGVFVKGNQQPARAWNLANRSPEQA